MPETSLQSLMNKRSLWLRAAKVWNAIHWFIGILGVTMSALAAASTVSGPAAPYFSVVAAICFSIIGFANPQRQSIRYIRGYLILDHALLKYAEGLISKEQLYQAHENAESAIHNNIEQAAFQNTTTT